LRNNGKLLLMYAYLEWLLLGAFALSLVLWIVRAASHRQIKSSWVYCGLGLTLWLLYPVPTGIGAALALAFTELAVLQLAVAALDVLILTPYNAPRFVGEILLAGGYIVVVIAVPAHVGMNLTGLIATSAVVTAVVGLSLQDMLVNLVGGVVLELEQTVKVGDWIRNDQISGAVTAVRLRHTSIQTSDNDLVLVPNSSLIRLPVTIVSRKHRRLIPFHLPYGCNPAKVVEQVGQALAASPINGVCTDPKPRCVVLDFHAAHVTFGAFVWLSDPAREHSTVSAALLRVHFALGRMGLPLTSISQVVEMTRAPLPKPNGEGLIAHRVEMLRAAPIFRVLSEEAALRVASSCRDAEFAPGELIIRQGEDGDSMYIVTEGSVDVHVIGESGMSEYVSTLEVGQFFGEMSLLTGEKRTANVMAMTMVSCLRVGKPCLTDLFEQHPEVAADISEVVAGRQAELAVTRERLDGEQQRVLAARNRKAVLERIQRYFGISA
jgi:small-conductance mechanosensitive channel/CRP-like cAMP-binding protein